MLAEDNRRSRAQIVASLPTAYCLLPTNRSDYEQSGAVQLAFARHILETTDGDPTAPIKRDHLVKS
jgi:hypothetical protein